MLLEVRGSKMKKKICDRFRVLRRMFFLVSEGNVSFARKETFPLLVRKVFLVEF